MSSIFKTNFWMTKYYTFLLNRNEGSFLTFQTALKVLLSLFSALTFYMTVTIHPKSHAFMAKDCHLLFNIPYSRLQFKILSLFSLQIQQNIKMLSNFKTNKLIMDCSYNCYFMQTFFFNLN